MAKKRIMLNIDEDLDLRWKNVSKKIRMSKSAMLESMLEKFIPALENEGMDIVSSVYLFDTENRRFKGVGSLFDEKENN